MRNLGRTEFDAQLTDDAAVARINDEAFEKNLRLVLNSLARRA
jgi:hypothetical protein